MVVNHNVEFYLKTDRCKVVEMTAQTPFLSFEDILGIRDVYIKYFLLTSLVDLPAVECNEKIAAKLKLFFRELREIQHIIEIDFNEKMVDLVQKKTVIKDMKGFISCASELHLSETGLDHYRKFFGYSQIYWLYKSIIEKIFKHRFSYREIGLVMLLLNNEQLCFKRLLPIFNRLKIYARDGVVDKNIVACCTVLRSVLTYIPRAFKEKDEYVISLISYFSRIICQRTSYSFINRNDASEVILIIESLANYNFLTDCGQVCMGIFREIVLNLGELTTCETGVYEDILAITCMLRIIPIVYTLLNRFSCAECDFSRVHFIVKQLNIRRMDYICEREWLHISDMFFMGKYRCLDTIYAGRNTGFDRIGFCNDISAAPHPSKIFTEIKNMKSEVSWSDVIVFACNAQNKEEFLRFIFDDFFMDKIEHSTYVSLFIEASGNRPDILLYSGYLLLRSIKSACTEKKHELLAGLYVRSMQGKDQRFIRLRHIISNYMSELKDLETKCALIEILVKKLQAEVLCFNLGVISLLHMFLSRSKEISKGISITIALYLRDCVVSESKRKECINNFHKLEAVYISAAAKAMTLSCEDMLPSENDSGSLTYYTFVVSCLVWRRKKSSTQKSFEDIKSRMFDFLLDAEKNDVCELRKLIREESSKFIVKFDELYGAQSSDGNF